MNQLTFESLKDRVMHGIHYMLRLKFLRWQTVGTFRATANRLEFFGLSRLQQLQPFSLSISTHARAKMCNSKTSEGTSTHTQSFSPYRLG